MVQEKVIRLFELDGFIMVLSLPSLLWRCYLVLAWKLLYSCWCSPLPVSECLAEELTLRRMAMVAKGLPCANMTAWVLGNSEFRKRISGQMYLSVLTGLFQIS